MTKVLNRHRIIAVITEVILNTGYWIWGRHMFPVRITSRTMWAAILCFDLAILATMSGQTVLENRIERPEQGCNKTVPFFYQVVLSACIFTAAVKALQIITDTRMSPAVPILIGLICSACHLAVGYALDITCSLNVTELRKVWHPEEENTSDDVDP